MTWSIHQRKTKSSTPDEDTPAISALNRLQSSCLLSLKTLWFQNAATSSRANGRFPNLRKRKRVSPCGHECLGSLPPTKALASALANPPSCINWNIDISRPAIFKLRSSTDVAMRILPESGLKVFRNLVRAFSSFSRELCEGQTIHYNKCPVGTQLPHSRP